MLIVPEESTTKLVMGTLSCFSLVFEMDDILASTVAS